MYVEEVPKAVPPVDTLYQATVPAGFVGNVAVNFTVPVPHLETLGTDGAEGRGLIVAVTRFLAADLQPVVRLR